MSKIIAKVEGNIPKNRLLWLYAGDTPDEMKIGLPRELGNYVDFLTNVDLEDGQEVTVNITGNPIWTVECATNVVVGGNVSVDTDGRVGSYTSAPIRIGYALDSGQEGDLIRIVRNPKVYLDKINSTEG